MVFCPALDFGETGALGKESEENEGEEGVEGMRLSTFGAGIRNFSETLDEMSQGMGSGWERKKLREEKEWNVCSYYVKKVDAEGKK